MLRFHSTVLYVCTLLFASLLAGCAVQEDVHFRIAPSPENPREIKLGGMVTDQILALWEQTGQNSEETLELLRAGTESSPIVIENTLAINKTTQEFWAEAIEPGKQWSFRAALRAVSLRVSDRALCIRLVGTVNNRRVAYWTWCSRDFLGDPVKHIDTVNAEMPRIVIADDVLAFANSEEAFIPSGLDGAPIHQFEPTAETDWTRLEEDYADIKGLGANFVRVHLQIGNFMDTATRPNQEALNALRRLIGIAEAQELYVVITGLACYQSDVIPRWHEFSSEAGRWNAQATFWAAVARTCATSNAVFAYDLMNGAVLDDEPESDVSRWLVGNPLSVEGVDYYTTQRLVRNVWLRDPVTVRKDWVDKMSASIRKHDPNTLLTVRTDDLPGFYRNEVDENLDFVGVHACQTTGLGNYEQYEFDKPVVVLPFALSDAPSITTSLVAAIEGHSVDVVGCNLTQFDNLQARLNDSPVNILNVTETNVTLDIPSGANSGQLVFESDQGSTSVDVEVYEYTSTEIGSQNGHALSIVVDSSSRVWVNMEFHKQLVKLEDGEVSLFTIPTPANGVFAIRLNGNDRETSLSVLGEDIVVGPDDNIWFTQGGASLYAGQFDNHSRIVKFDPESEEFSAYNLPGTHNEIIGMTFAPDGTIWACQGNLEEAAIWHFDPNTVEPDNDFDFSTSLDSLICDNLTEGCFQKYSIPPQNSLHPAHLLIDASGDVWFTNFWHSSISRLDPITGDVDTYKTHLRPESPLPIVGSGPWEIYQEPNGDIVFNEFFDNTINWLDYSRINEDACLNHDGNGPNPCVHSVKVGELDEVQTHSIRPGVGGRTWFTTFSDRDEPFPTTVGFVTKRGEVHLLPTLSDVEPNGGGGQAGIAIDPNTGDIYFAEFWNNSIGKLRLR